MGFAMTPQRPLVAYVFAYLPKRPSSVEEIRDNPSITLQCQYIQQFATASAQKIKRLLVGTSVYRRKPFTKSDKFLEAMKVAASHDCDLALADIAELLSRTAEDQIVTCVRALDAAKVKIWDASSRTEWQSLPVVRRQEIILHSMRARAFRSQSVKAGIRNMKNERSARSTSNGLRGNRINKLKADRAALQLRDFVRSEQEKLGTGGRLSPAALARSMNEAGIPSARGGAWSFNSAKNLLERLARMDEPDRSLTQRSEDPEKEGKNSGCSGRK